MTGLSPHNELNVYESAEARFEIAAKKLGLEDGVYRFMRYPNKEITVYIPVTLDNGSSKSSSATACIIRWCAGRARAAFVLRPT